jgi:hypothetical protein
MYRGSGPTSVLYLWAAVAASVVAGCTEKVAVTSQSADNADFSAYRTFSMMTVPQRTAATDAATQGATSPTGGAAVTSAGDVANGSANQMDPMLASSPVGSAIRKDIVQSFTGRGYSESSAPDFLVAFYAGTGDIVDIKAYPYGYSGMSNTGKVDIRDYPAGTVIVDVVDAKTQALVWRGQGVTKIPNDADLYSHQIAVTVADIVSQFPKLGQKKS